jgi:hypothetical protein
VAGVVALAALANVLFVTHPLLLMVAALAAPVLGGIIAQALVRPRPDLPDSQQADREP